MILVFIGSPGVGKGTQAQKLCQENSLNHIATGDILRDALKRQAYVGNQAKDYIDRGELVPDYLVQELIEQRISDLGYDSSFVFDGFPRNLNQAQALDQILKEHHRSIDAAIYFDCPESVIIERISGRRSCRKCESNFHVKYLPPKSDNLCDHCGGELYQRSDDREEAIKQRLKVYVNETQNLIDYYKKCSLLHTVDGSKNPEQVYQQILAVYKRF